MAGSPQTQNFAVVWPTNFGASIFDSNDVVAAFNAMPAVVLNDTLAGIFDVDFFVNRGHDVTSSSVNGAKWINYGEKLALAFNLNTMSDPISAADVVAALAVAGAIVIAGLTAAGLLDGIAPGLLILGLVAIGVLAFVAPLVTDITSFFSSGAGQIILYGGAAVAVSLLIFGVYQYLKNPEVKRNVDRTAGNITRKVASYA
jgi:hypothetical protein